MVTQTEAVVRQRYVRLTVLVTEQQMRYLDDRYRELGARYGESIGRSLNVAQRIDEERAVGGTPQIDYDGVVRTLQIPE